MIRSFDTMENLEITDCNHPLEIQLTNHRRKKGCPVSVPCRILPHELFVYENLGMVDIKYSEDNGLTLISTLTGMFVFLGVLKNNAAGGRDEEMIDWEEVTIGKKAISVFFKSLSSLSIGLLMIPNTEKEYEKYLSFPEYGNSPKFDTDTISDMQFLLKSLKEHRTISVQRIWSFLNQKCRKRIEKWTDNNPVEKSLATSVIKGMNEILEKADFYDSEAFKGLDIGKDGKELYENVHKNPDINNLRRFNRLIFEAIYPHQIKKCRGIHSVFIWAQEKTFENFTDHVYDYLIQNPDTKTLKIDQKFLGDNFCLGKDSLKVKLSILDADEFFERYKIIPQGLINADKITDEIKKNSYIMNDPSPYLTNKSKPFRMFFYLAWCMQITYNYKYKCEKIDKVVITLFRDRWKKAFGVNPPMELEWQTYLRIEFWESSEKNQIDSFKPEKTKYPFLPGDYSASKHQTEAASQYKEVDFPIFFVLRDKRILMFENLEELNGFLRISDYELIIGNQCLDIKGCKCRIKVYTESSDDVYEKFCFYSGGNLFLPVRISTEPQKEVLIEAIYKYGIIQSKRITNFILTGKISSDDLNRLVVKSEAYAKVASEMEQRILDDIFETNFLYSEPTDEAIKEFYNTFCGFL